MKKNKKLLSIIISSLIITMVGAVLLNMHSNHVIDNIVFEVTIEDLVHDQITIEVTSNEVWLQLIGMQQDGSSKWVGGIVEAYDNVWGFGFKPDTVKVAELTAEGLQTQIQYISDDLNYWLDSWAYIYAKVVDYEEVVIPV